MVKKFITVNRSAPGCAWLLILSLLYGSTVVAETDDLRREQRFREVRHDIELQYPQVRHITIEQYRAEHADALLIDVRAAREYAVSHIPGAVHVADEAELLRLAGNHKGEIILYCSLGWRSARGVAYLAEQGVADVMNLHGSIFAWANQGLPLHNDQGQVSKVHPYNVLWGWLYLDERLR